MVPFKTTSLNVSAAAVVGTTLSAQGIIYAQGGNSSQWNSTYTTVLANSASWEESADILPTVTNYLSTNNVLLSSATVTNTLSISSVQIRTRGTSNVFIGNSTTGNNNATGNHNFVFGLSAGNALTTGINNVFIGACAGRATTTSCDNNFIGYNAGLSNTTGNFNNFFGRFAGLSNTTGCNNNFLGVAAGRYNTTGCNNNFLGVAAGEFNTRGSNNSFFGHNAGKLVFALAAAVGSKNSFFGDSAGVGSSTFTEVSASNNSFFGFGAGRAITNGCNNNFFGYNAGCANTTGNFNNFIGDFVGRNNTTGSFNNFLGNNAGCSNTTGNSNLFLGNSAGGFNRVGSNNIFIGNNANTASAQVSALSGVIAIGTGAIATQTNQIVLSTADISIRSLRGTAAGPNLFIGDSTTGRDTATGNHNFVFGLSAGNALTTGSSNVFVGDLAGRANTTGGNNTIIGCCAGHNNTSGSGNTFIGLAAGCSNTTGCHNHFLGEQAGCSFTNNFNVVIGGFGGYNATTGSGNIHINTCRNVTRSGTDTGCNNNFLGIGAGINNTTGGYNNFLGSCAGCSNTSGTNNNFLGSFAGSSNTTGCNNNFLGVCAGFNNIDGYSNNFFGQSAGYCNTSGFSNNFLGLIAGGYNTTGSHNNFLGNWAGICNTTGNNNNFLGQMAGYFTSTGNDNIFIGRNSGCSNRDGNNNIIIGSLANTSFALSGVIVLGNNAIATESHQVVLSSQNVLFRSLSNTFNIGASNQPNNLTVFGTISTSSHGNSTQWNEAYNVATTYQSTSGQFALSAHAASHHTGGTDAIAPNNISAAWATVVSDQGISGNTLLTAGRNRRINLGAFFITANVDLPYENNQAGDVVTLILTPGVSSTLTIRRALAMSGGSPSAYSTLATLQEVNQSFTFVSDGTATGWSLRLVDSHDASRVISGTFANARIPALNYLPLSGGTITGSPNSALTVVGTISSNNIIYAQGGNSSQWNSTYTTVLANSASWEESADILPTVTNYLSTSNVLLSSATVTGNLSASNSITARDVTATNLLSAARVLSVRDVQVRTVGTSNVFIGDSTTGRDAATGNHNFVFGLSAGNALTTGVNNVFIGACAGRVNTIGNSNNFFGNRAGFSNTTGYSNNFLGPNTGNRNTTGGFNNFIGNYAGNSNTTGINNNFLGSGAGHFNTTGGSNNFLGYRAGFWNTTGFNNNFFGYNAGGFNRVGSNNLFIGNNANTASAQVSALSGVIAIGTGAIATESHQIVLSSQNVLFRSLSNTFNIGASNQPNNLTVFGTISTSSHGNSTQWNKAYNVATTYQSTSGQFALSAHAASHAAGTKAQYNDQVAGMTENVLIRANTAGTAGNSITLPFDGVDDIDTVLAAWNSANPSNQATLISGDGGQVPDNGEEIALSGGVAGGSDPILAAKFDSLNINGGEVEFGGSLNAYNLPFKVRSNDTSNTQIAQVLGFNGKGAAFYGTGGLSTDGPIVQATEYEVTNNVNFYVNAYGGNVIVGATTNNGAKLQVGGNLTLKDLDNDQTATFDAQSNLTDNRTYDLPDASGTLALISDIPSIPALNYLPLSGGTITGSLSVLGDITYMDTAVQVTSAMFIDTTSTETALRITQKGSGDVIRVEDSPTPDSTPFIVKSTGLVGIGTDNPNSALTVVGNISSNNIIYAQGGNSSQWNSTYTTVQSNSASWDINNIDGGSSTSAYLLNQNINGGLSNTF